MPLLLFYLVMTRRLNIPVDDALYDRLDRLPGPLTEKVRAALEAWIPGEERRLLEELKKEPATTSENIGLANQELSTEVGAPT